MHDVFVSLSFEDQTILILFRHFLDLVQISAKQLGLRGSKAG